MVVMINILEYFVLIIVNFQYLNGFLFFKFVLLYVGVNLYMYLFDFLFFVIRLFCIKMYIISCLIVNENIIFYKYIYILFYFKGYEILKLKYYYKILLFDN